MLIQRASNWPVHSQSFILAVSITTLPGAETLLQEIVLEISMANQLSKGHQTLAKFTIKPWS